MFEFAVDWLGNIDDALDDCPNQGIKRRVEVAGLLQRILQVEQQVPDQFGNVPIDDCYVTELAAEDMALGDGFVGDVNQPIHSLLKDELARIRIGIDTHLTGDEDRLCLGVDIADADDVDLRNILEYLQKSRAACAAAYNADVDRTYFFVLEVCIHAVSSFI